MVFSPSGTLIAVSSGSGQIGFVTFDLQSLQMNFIYEFGSSYSSLNKGLLFLDENTLILGLGNTL